MFHTIIHFLYFQFFGVIKVIYLLVKKGEYACAWITFNISLCSLYLITPILILTYLHFGSITTVTAGIVISLSMLGSIAYLIDNALKTINNLIKAIEG